MKEAWFSSAIRTFFASVDKAIYGLIGTIYNLIIEIANADIIQYSTIEEMFTRIYTFLGIFMFFKVAFSFINYIINPEAFTDKTKGVQNLVRNIIIVLVMILVTPFAFDKLYEAQSAVLTDALIPRIILGSTGSDSTKNLEHAFQISEECKGYYATAETDGDMIALVTLKPFYQIDSTADRHTFPDEYCPQSSVSVTPSDYLIDDIYNAMDSNDIYYVDYKFFLSTLVGIAVALILIGFVFDVGVRAIDLVFLEVIAPIPIMSYIDPATSKNGMFSKWLKQVGSTWAGLFVRLIALFFAVKLISVFNISQGNMWFTLALLIAALMFAKQLPKKLEDLFGIKSGGFSLNPFKKISNEALFGKQVLGLAGAGIGGILGATSYLGYRTKAGIDAAKENKEMRNKALDDYDFNKFKSNAKSMLKSGDLSRKEYRKLVAERKGEIMSGSGVVDEIASKRAERLSKRSYSNIIGASIAQTFSGMKMGFKQAESGHFNPREVGKYSAGVRDYRDAYGTKDRVTDAATDFFGIKNDSGTTEMNAKMVKEANDRLTNINRSIEMMNKSFSDLATKMGPAEFSKAASWDASSGKYVMNSSYTGSYANDLKSIMTEMTNLENQRLSTVKEINRLEKIRDKKPPKPPGAK